MPQITIDEDTHQRLELAARVAGISIAEVIRVLIESRHPEVSGGLRATAPRWVPIFANYLGSKVEGEFNPDSGSVRITTGPLGGQEYPAPSPAAIAVVQVTNPDREDPHTNGWRFWKDMKTRRNLDSVFSRPG